MPKKIPFKISAKTARLIGRQNFPNAEGAIIELVKNCYDADASVCIIVFDNKYAGIPEILNKFDYFEFSKEENLISKYYEYDKERGVYFYIKSFSNNDHQSENDNNRKTLQDFFRAQCKLFIIDNGEGMTDKIIEDFWMTIGTNNKELNFHTRSGRVITGEKGIGRFALDKLGDTVEMLTKPNLEVYREIVKDRAFLWQMNWNIFEGDSKTLNQVEADLIDIDNIDFIQEVMHVLPINSLKHSDLNISTFTTGTRIEIGALRDNWDEYTVSKLFTNLEVLIPPREERIFDIFLLSTSTPQNYGKVSPSICNDYDYKIDAHIDKDGIAKITIYRNEFDVKLLPNDFYNREILQKDGFTNESVKQRKIIVSRHIRELIPGLIDKDNNDVLGNVGVFDCVFYFMKAQATQKDREVFLYKDFNSSSRKVWFDHFGGIKLFRDNFRVRPYGEKDNPAFDWLQLGERATRSPSSIGQQRPESWKVRPNQITGIINISRLTNINFEDTSSRYGLQENRTFNYFIQIILGILGEFEKDRSNIGRKLRAFYDETHKDIISEETAQFVKKRVGKTKTKSRKSQVEEDAITLLKITENLEERIEELTDETNLLKILASNGLIIASFTHELKNIKDNLVFRIDELHDALNKVIDLERCKILPDFLNPFTMLEIIKHEDENLKEWLHYSIETLRRDKRFRKDVNLIDYLQRYKISWASACEKRGVEFNLILPRYDELLFRVFEADLDCIFNNLLINSFEAFLRKDAPPERQISLILEIHGSDIHFIYHDSGPGLSKDIKESEQIFEPHFTTKKDVHTGENTGTGLGMWLVKSFVNENNGEIILQTNSRGFGVLIKFFNRVN